MSTRLTIATISLVFVGVYLMFEVGRMHSSFYNMRFIVFSLIVVAVVVLPIFLSRFLVDDDMAQKSAQSLSYGDKEVKHHQPTNMKVSTPLIMVISLLSSLVITTAIVMMTGQAFPMGFPIGILAVCILFAIVTPVLLFKYFPVIIEIAKIPVPPKTHPKYSRPKVFKTMREKLFSKYADIETAYEKTRALYLIIQQADLPSNQKKYADDLMKLCESLIVDFSKLNDIRELTTENYLTAMTMFNKALSLMTTAEKEFLYSADTDLNNQVLEVTRSQRVKLKSLMDEGEVLLATIDRDKEYANSEDRFVIEKIVKTELTELWGDYVNAVEVTTKLNETIPKDAPLSLGCDNQKRIEDQYNGSLDRIRAIYRDVEFRLNHKRADDAISALTAKRRYFENR